MKFVINTNTVLFIVKFVTSSIVKFGTIEIVKFGTMGGVVIQILIVNIFTNGCQKKSIKALFHEVAKKILRCFPTVTILIGFA